MKKESTAESSELRPEYDLSQLKGGVRGKYYRRDHQIAFETGSDGRITGFKLRRARRDKPVDPRLS